MGGVARRQGRPRHEGGPQAADRCADSQRGCLRTVTAKPVALSDSAPSAATPIGHPPAIGTVAPGGIVPKMVERFFGCGPPEGAFRDEPLPRPPRARGAL